MRLMVLGALGLFGAALLYGDGVITPAVSVLGAVEGIDVATPALRHLVVPISVVVLFVLFLFQRGGTTKIGRVFGPVMTLWFGSIALFGAMEIAKEPSILKAVNPWYARAVLRQPRISRDLHSRLRRARRSRGQKRSTRTWDISGDCPFASRGPCTSFPPAAQLFRTGRAAAARSHRVLQSVLPPHSRRRDLSDADPRDGRRGDRVAGAHLGRVLAHASGDAAGILAAG